MAGAWFRAYNSGIPNFQGQQALRFRKLAAARGHTREGPHQHPCPAEPRQGSEGRRRRCSVVSLSLLPAVALVPFLGRPFTHTAGQKSRAVAPLRAQSPPPSLLRKAGLEDTHLSPSK